MILVSIHLKGNNYLIWYRFVIITLRVKDKLSFINNKCEKLEEGYDELEKWIKVDSMVTSQILNSISNNTVEFFLYITSIKKLWEELAQRFDDSDESQIY